MNNAFKGFGLVLLGTLLVAGCGGMEPEPLDMQEPQQSLEEPDPVTAEAACCYAKCSDQKWHGPFKKITYGNCANYSKFWCSNHNMGYVSAQWDDC
ncbi:hypothetical protein [Stigmatella erecta]|uniref:Lipoprotein n=1 Tax=Stigmatella erecta TaxID=83460 RepID=A0A1I0L0E3_9BACT|nr:hypothetical protein [Stigmatella erecta]SEU31532.1 hypothetical protein SAMN05443639_11653 [Stigmatella erecta]